MEYVHRVDDGAVTDMPVAFYVCLARALSEACLGLLVARGGPLWGRMLRRPSGASAPWTTLRLKFGSKLPSFSR